jgi:8-oxo-dGTP pyrophosphatase MutT (NUDIX family)
MLCNLKAIKTMHFETFIKSVPHIAQSSLPGTDSQFKMSPPFRNELIAQQQELMKQSRKAGVMALFYPNTKGITHLVLILRKTYQGVHSAQIGFPGGKLEPEDSSIEYAALRETYEEVGVPIESVKVIKALTEVYIPPSNFTVYPFIGITENTPVFTKQDDEVEAIIELQLQELFHDGNQTSQRVMTSLNMEVEVPAFELNGYLVWGATAMMLSEIKDLLKTVL